MFKKKPTPLIQPPPRVLKDWGDRRLVETFEPVHEVYVGKGSAPQLLSYRSVLVIEKASVDKIGGRKYDVERTETTVGSNYYTSSSHFQDLILLFVILRQTYVGKVD